MTSPALADELVAEAERLEALARPYDPERVVAVLTPAGLDRTARLLRTAADVVTVADGLATTVLAL